MANAAEAENGVSERWNRQSDYMSIITSEAMGCKALGVKRAFWLSECYKGAGRLLSAFTYVAYNGIRSRRSTMFVFRLSSDDSWYADDDAGIRHTSGLLDAVPVLASEAQGRPFMASVKLREGRGAESVFPDAR